MSTTTIKHNELPGGIPIPNPDATRRRFIAILEEARINLRRVYVIWHNCHGRQCAIFGTVHLLDDHHVSVLFWSTDTCDTIRITSIFAIHVLSDSDAEAAA